MNQAQIRNFAIIAHIDHGKTTLTDRLIQFTHTVADRDLDQRLLDSNPIEKERGITIKLAPVTMQYVHNDTRYQLNLIDTPGHVDFSYEVERSLAACEAALLLIDATQGVQAQTLAHSHKALNLGLHLIPALNKIDLDSSNIPGTVEELHNVFGFKADEITHISAKTGEGVETLINRLVGEVDSPAGESTQPLRALVFNSIYDPHLGVVAFIRLIDGHLSANQSVYLMKSGHQLKLKELGIFTPQRTPLTALSTGQVGYIATGLKDIHQLKVGDTLTSLDDRATLPLPGYQEPAHTVFADIYPSEGTDASDLKKALEKLKLTDAALITKPIHSAALGNGFRLGFLGLFHVEISKERLEREHNLTIIVTNPTVEYQVTTVIGEVVDIQNPTELPDPSLISSIREPYAQATIISPTVYLGNIMDLMEKNRALYQTTHHLGDRVQLVYHLPLAELISGLFDKLKSASSGFASLDYHLIDAQPVEAVKLSILLNHQDIPSLARIVVTSQAEKIGRKVVETIKDIIPRHAFAVPIQAAVGGRVVARATKPAFRKDVTAKLYGGDQTRKDKLLKKQKKGKKRMAQFGRVQVPDNLFTQLAKM